MCRAGGTQEGTLETALVSRHPPKTDARDTYLYLKMSNKNCGSLKFCVLVQLLVIRRDCLTTQLRIAFLYNSLVLQLRDNYLDNL